MAMDLDLIRANFPKMVPMVGTLNLEWVELSPEVAAMRLPDQQPYHNHIAGPHAGAMFTLGESASGAIVLLNFGDQLDRLVPLAVEARIRYLKIAMGPVTATARLSRPLADIQAEVDAGTKRPEFAVEIEFTDAQGTVTGAMTVVWTLKLLAKV
jgi:acyl-coenzyme A thioesterase PaaI-like protein